MFFCCIPTKRHSDYPKSSYEELTIYKFPLWAPELPTIHLRIHPLSAEGCEEFTRLFPDVCAILKNAIHTCWELLYNNEFHLIPSIRDITLYVRPFHDKEPFAVQSIGTDIHLNANYVLRSGELARNEIHGVLIYAMACIWQNHGNAPGGLCSGIADYLRLRAGFAPPHWHRGDGKHWDDGFHVTAYFLDWIENRHKGFVRTLNASLKDGKLDKGIFKFICEKGVEELWSEYRKDMAINVNKSG